MVGDDTYRAQRVVIATGTAPALPPIDGLADLRASGDGADGPVWTNREAMKTLAAPPRWSCSVAGRSAANWRRRSPGSARG